MFHPTKENIGSIFEKRKLGSPKFTFATRIFIQKFLGHYVFLIFVLFFPGTFEDPKLTPKSWRYCFGQALGVSCLHQSDIENNAHSPGQVRSPGPLDEI